MPNQRAAKCFPNARSCFKCIIAPMEAEAQCAYMEFCNLVDGVDIENELGLNREKLIDMALLLGSDYTEGVSGIDKHWHCPWKSLMHFLRKLAFMNFRSGLSHLNLPFLEILMDRKGSKDHDILKSSSSSNAEERSCDQNNIKMMKHIFMDKHRNVSKNWHIPSSFPSDAVISAYTSPQVDKSNEPFSWGKLDLFALRKLCWEKFGSGSSKADDLLLLVLKKYNKHECQLGLVLSIWFLMGEEMPQQSRVGKKRKAMPSELEAETSGTRSKEPDRAGTANQISTKKETNVGLSKRGRRKEISSKLDGSNLEQSTSIDQSLSMKGKSGAGGRQKARGRQKETEGGSRKRNSHFEDAEMSYDDDDNGGGVGCREKGGLQFDESEESHQVRRVVNYCIPDEFDDRDKESEVDNDTTTKDSSVGTLHMWMG